MAAQPQGLSREQTRTEIVAQLKPLRDDIFAVSQRVEKVGQSVLQPKIAANPAIQLIALEARVKRIEGRVGTEIENLDSQIHALANAFADSSGVEVQVEDARATPPASAPTIESPKSVAALPFLAQSPGASRQPWRMPEGWERTLCEARDLSELNAPYTDRVRNLSHVLARLPGETVPARVVHLLHKDGYFEIHEAEDQSPLTCQRCGDTDQRQFAVRIGERNGLEAGILFPLGNYHKGHYPAGYPALIDKCPEGEFQIDEVLSPARLRRATSTGLFNVAERMKLVVT
jgi:hypothetical protein